MRGEGGGVNVYFYEGKKGRELAVQCTILQLNCRSLRVLQMPLL